MRSSLELSDDKQGERFSVDGMPRIHMGCVWKFYIVGLFGALLLDVSLVSANTATSQEKITCNSPPVTCPPGPAGPPGVAGPRGQNGERGPPGPPGDSGATALQISTLNETVEDLKSKLEQLLRAMEFYKKMVKGGKKKYVQHDYMASYAEGKALCANAGGQLATPRNREENTAVYNLRLKYQQNAILGIDDIEKEGEFRDLHGEKITFSQWYFNRPDDSDGNEDCIEMMDNGHWDDVSCDTEGLIICEF